MVAFVVFAGVALVALLILGTTTVTAQVAQTFTPTEKFTGTDLGAGGVSVSHPGLNVTKNLTGTSTPPIAKCAFPTVTLSAGAGALDLTACAGGTNGTTVDFTGAKLCAVLIVAPATNAAAITITPGVSNGYNLFGASCSYTLAPGDSVLAFFNASTPAVGSTHKALAFAGTGTDVLNIGIGAG